jgi:hypothetical protein
VSTDNTKKVEKGGKVDCNLIQDFRMSKADKRLPIMADWLESVLLRFIERNGVGNIEFLNRVYKDSKKFTNRPILEQDDPFIQWYLPEEWFHSIFAQCLQGVNDADLIATFRDLKWDYERALNPKVESGSTLQAFNISSVIQDADNVILRLVSRDAYPVDTVLTNNMSHEKWTVLGKSGDKYEIEHDSGMINYRRSSDLYSNYTVVSE